MKISVERSKLLRVISQISRVVERRSTLAILSNVLIEASDDFLRLTGSDLELELRETVEANVTEAGATTANAAILLDIVRRLPDGGQLTMSLRPDRSQLAIACGRSHFSLPALSRSEFPLAEEEDSSTSFRMPSTTLKRLLGKVQFAMSTEETRYYLNGVYLHRVEEAGQSYLRAATTDGHRLARSEIQAPGNSAGMPGIIVPRKCIGEFLRVLERLGETDLDISLSETRFSARAESVNMTSKVIDGSFPDYHQVIPFSNTRVLEFDRGAFTGALERVATVASERTRGVKLYLSTDRTKMQVSNPEMGFAEEEIDAKYTDEPMEIGFNSRYLLELLSQLEEDTVRMLLSDGRSPVLVKESGEGSPVLLVLMPLHI